MLKRYRHIQIATEFSDERLAQLANALDGIDLKGANVVANGSFARREASQLSDLDYFLLFPAIIHDDDADQVVSSVRAIVEGIVGKQPSPDGAFGTWIRMNEMQSQIGGDDDTNRRFTRRVLFLTEGYAVGRENLFREQKEALIERYVQNGITDHQLALFLLNDIVRYYRTVCVDFEYKTFEQGKEWGLRNIKLIFSRKLLYYAGILMVAETYQRTLGEKREILSQLMDLTPLQRISALCGHNADKALSEYDHFLEEISTPRTREILSSVRRDGDRPEIFRRLKNTGHHFSIHLLGALTNTYSDGHPIHRALVF